MTRSQWKQQNKAKVMFYLCFFDTGQPTGSAEAKVPGDAGLGVS
jgi:hypothetical protein